MLRDHPTPDAATEPASVVLTCGDPHCRHTFAPHPSALATGSLACPRCEGWTFTVQLTEPAAAKAGDRR